MSDLLSQVDKSRLPRHIAIIMDGNGRWAKEQGQDRLFGHFHGVESVRNIVEGCAELGVEYLTLYAFSTENWDRPEYEVVGLMELLVSTIHNEVESLHKNNIRLHVIGDMNMLPDYAKKELEEALVYTKNNTGLNLIMALSYTGLLRASMLDLMINFFSFHLFSRFSKPPFSPLVVDYGFVQVLFSEIGPTDLGKIQFCIR